VSEIDEATRGNLVVTGDCATGHNLLVMQRSRGREDRLRRPPVVFILICESVPRSVPRRFLRLSRVR